MMPIPPRSNRAEVEDLVFSILLPVFPEKGSVTVESRVVLRSVI